jgi:hypothetical protein
MKKAEGYKDYVVKRGLISRLRPTDEDIKPFTGDSKTKKGK